MEDIHRLILNISEILGNSLLIGSFIIVGGCMYLAKDLANRVANMDLPNEVSSYGSNNGL